MNAFAAALFLVLISLSVSAKPKVGADGSTQVCAIPMGEECMIVEPMKGAKGPKFTLRYVDEYTCVLDCPGEFTANCPENKSSKADASICPNSPKKITRVHCQCVVKTNASKQPAPGKMNEQPAPSDTKPEAAEAKQDPRGRRHK